MSKFKGLPVAEHKQFPEVYNEYVSKYNRLAECMDKVGIDIGMLRDVVSATQDLERLSIIHFLELGRNHLLNTDDLANRLTA